MTQRTLDPRMLDSSQALPAMSGAALTGLATDFVKINESNPSGASDVTFTSSHFNNSTYNTYLFTFGNIAPSNDGTHWTLVTSTDAGSSYGSSYQWTQKQTAVNGAESILQYETASTIQMTTDNNWGSASNEELSGHIWLYQPGDAKQGKFTWHCAYDDDQAGTYFTQNIGSARTNTATDIDTVKFAPSAGTITGTIIMYGLK